MKVISIVGARPQFIKVDAFQRAARLQPDMRHLVLHTGQHYDDNMSALFFEEMEIGQPDFHLNRYTDKTPSISGMKAGIIKVLKAERPNLVIVYGDTNTTLAGALAAKAENIQLAHIEAGLRSFNNEMPEEINRVETDNLSDILFCPTEKARQNLLEEGYADASKQIVVCGDITLDAFKYYSNKLKISEEISPFILCTLHRRALIENEKKLSSIIEALNVIAEANSIIIPLHPSLKTVIRKFFLHPSIRIIEPVGYLKMLSLLQTCSVVMTDSGGLQKEAYFSQKPCVTLRNETEWIELAEAGVNIIGSDNCTKDIVDAYEESFKIQTGFEQRLYGDGNTAAKIVTSIIEYFSSTPLSSSLHFPNNDLQQQFVHSV
jgi:UDP-GlcNAc3NAcA epimerase